MNLIKKDLHNTKKNNLQQKITNSHYNKVMSNRHIQMIALGGTIGSGLFLGSSIRLKIMGPSLIIMYIICGFFCYLIMRALGELISYKPSSGSFISYSREFLGKYAEYVSGWMYFINWIMTGIVDMMAISLYMHRWYYFHNISTWILVMITLLIVCIINVIGVKYFAEIEFWLAFIKVFTLVSFLLIGTFILCSYYIFHYLIINIPIDATMNFITNNNKYIFFPYGIWKTILLTQGVIFSFASIELIGVTAGECQNPHQTLPKAINGVIWRIMLFYIGSITLLILLIPLNQYKGYISPFITVLQKFRIPYMDSFMNIVIISAALSSLNSGLYSIGRILRAMAIGNVAPRIFIKMNRYKIPYISIIITVIVYLIGMYISDFLTNNIFVIILNIASLGVITSWTFILICQIKLRQAIRQGKIKEVSYKMPGSPLTSWCTLLFLFFILCTIACNYPSGTYAICCVPILSLILYIGWFFMQKNKNT
ncbi:amino acid permease [Enterobacteriaceae endosymbiont of Macroplea appendiculata]|uniref:amino acid permease n=1 Tax=Enterobacteriaceae endosymbiont of Macroplea appendiculata TaxID=2675790 RepID=UPI0014497384|nr:amino acid permease [Enterobacteriaceae endosymbiont of Macroplea appendiculata]QJC30816.1 amino acid permease [Enterobacteriaceae endosymbiont of Macroplea appendiculata]